MKVAEYNEMTALLDAELVQEGRLEPVAPLQAIDAYELAMMQFKPREVFLEPWLHSQDLCMIFAARGIGKTHFALGVAYAVATGGTFAKWSAPQARRVLYFDGELPGQVMQKRLLMHCPDIEPAPGFLRIFVQHLAGLIWIGCHDCLLGNCRLMRLSARRRSAEQGKTFISRDRFKRKLD